MNPTRAPEAQQIAEALTLLPDARIMMRWWWFGPAIRREDVDRQLELMHRAGIGGVEIAYIYPVCLAGEIKGGVLERFLSPAFCDVLHFAAEKARRLGMRFDLTLGSGWPFGGPHITTDHAAKQLKIQTLEVPAGIRAVACPAFIDGESFLTAIDDRGAVVPLQEGILQRSVPTPAASRVILLTQAPTGQKVKRAALGAEGQVLDHYNEGALQVHLEAVGQPLLDAVGAGRVHAIFTDSLEVYGGNWTDRFLAEFERRRGYDLAPFLPLLLRATVVGDADPDPDAGAVDRQCVEDIQHDYAQTLTELLSDRFLEPLERFAHRNGVLSRVQAYGVPPATLSSYRHVDLSEGETTLGSSDIQQPAAWTEITPNRFASSASRLKSHAIVSGETWTRLHSPPYAATPLDMKAEADEFFLQGVNQILGHGWCHRPAHGDPTQWVFYAAGNFNETNPWHPVMGDLSRYLQTVSALLRSGEAVVDVAIYLPDHDVWAGRTLSPSKDNLHHINALRKHIGLRLPEELLRCGLNFDLIDDHGLQALATAASPMRYRLILLPQVRRLPLATLEALQRLAGPSVTIVALGGIPDQPTGRAGREHEEERIRRLGHALFESGESDFVHALLEWKAEQLLAWCPPDVTFRQRTAALGYVHRRIGAHDLYFFANTTSQAIDLDPVFREKRKHTYRLDPMNRTACEVDRPSLTLDAFESAVLLRSDHVFTTLDFSDFRLQQAAPSEPVASCPLRGGWELRFPDGPRLELESPRLWTDWETLRSYAGEATYVRTIDVPPTWQGRPIELRFDNAVPVTPHRHDPARRNTGSMAFLEPPIRDAAEIFLDGQRIAALFCPPYRVDLTGRIQPGSHVLEIKVYNRLINALADRPRYDFSAVHRAYGPRFDEIQDFEQLHWEPAGLTGSVCLCLLG